MKAKETIETITAEILAVRDCEAVRNLLMDCQKIADTRGEAEGIAHARMLLDSITDYRDHERRIRGKVL